MMRPPAEEEPWGSGRGGTLDASQHPMRIPVPVVHAPSYEVDLGPHVFVTAKYRLVRRGMVAAGLMDDTDVVHPERASEADLGRVHTAAYLRKIREGDFTRDERIVLEVPFTPEVRDASILCCGGTILTARFAVEAGVAVHLGGGFHHAFADHGEGFCLLNDVAVAARVVQSEGLARRPVVVDLDVHHGNGTAAIFSSDPSVFTFSMHQDRNYPLVKPPGDLDRPLPDGMGDDEYLSVLDAALEEVMERHDPDLALYLAGADPYVEDQLGGLALSRPGLAERDRRVIEFFRKRDVPVAVTLAGGYARRLEDTVAIHLGTVRAALEVAS